MVAPEMIARLEPANVLLSPFRPATLHRVFSRVFAPAAFNDRPDGDSRFSPLHVADASGTGTRLVPTMYAGEALDVALMETVLRDVPFPSAGHSVRIPSPSRDNRVAVTVEVRRSLTLADLRANGLRRLGLRRGEVVECDSTHYPQTRMLARWIHENVPKAQGLVWTSRQHGSGDAFMFFGDRIAAKTLSAKDDGMPLASDEVLSVLMDLVEELGATLTIDP